MSCHKAPLLWIALSSYMCNDFFFCSLITETHGCLHCCVLREGVRNRLVSADPNVVEEACGPVFCSFWLMRRGEHPWTDTFAPSWSLLHDLLVVLTLSLGLSQEVDSCRENNNIDYQGSTCPNSAPVGNFRNTPPHQVSRAKLSLLPPIKDWIVSLKNIYWSPKPPNLLMWPYLEVDIL